MNETHRPYLVCDMDAVPLDPQPGQVLRLPSPIKLSCIKALGQELVWMFNTAKQVRQSVVEMTFEEMGGLETSEEVAK